jgi:cytidylate kinase
VAFAQPLQIAIDGPAASGKTTVAQLVADRLGVDFVDTGAMYRAVAYEALRRGIDPGDGPALARLANGALMEMVPGETLQSEDVTAIVSIVAAHPEVREAMVAAQRRVAEGRPLVMAGRDIGTVVLPHAAVKIYLTASVDARVERRRAQLEKAGTEIDARRLRNEIEARDRSDSTRAVSPLEPASDAHRIDSSDLTVSGVVDAILAIVRRAQEAR